MKLPFSLSQWRLKAKTPVILRGEPKDVEAEFASDADVLERLRENGDVPSIARLIDTRFFGEPTDLQMLSQAIGQRGWGVIQFVDLEDGGYALDVQRVQTAEAPAIRELTLEALALEREFDVEYDGWGCVAQTADKSQIE
jgi:regulator of RNase E activity RraB